MMDVTLTNEKDGDLGTLYSSKWMEQLFNMTIANDQVPFLSNIETSVCNVLRLSTQEQTLWIIAMQEEIKSLSSCNFGHW